jgi:hypothetical protein
VRDHCWFPPPSQSAEIVVCIHHDCEYGGENSQKADDWEYDMCQGLSETSNNMAVKLNIGTWVGRAGNPLPAAVANHAFSSTPTARTE